MKAGRARARVDAPGLAILLQKGEGTTLEYKEDVSSSLAREVRRFFNQGYVTCTLFRGTGRVHILDRKDFAGGVVSDIEESLLFVERNTRTA